MEEKFYLLENMKRIESIVSGKQKKFWSLKLSKAKHIHVSSIYDVFDKEKGKEIARMKLLSKYYQAESDAIYYFMKRYNEMMQKMLQNASRIRIRYRNRIKKYAKKIVEIGG